MQLILFPLLFDFPEAELGLLTRPKHVMVIRVLSPGVTLKTNYESKSLWMLKLHLGSKKQEF